MEPVPFVWDMCSDEEQSPRWEEEEEKSIDSNDYDWLRELLDMTDQENEDVVVLGEAKKLAHESKSSKSTESVKDDDDEEEDDCMILDVDPEKLVTSVTESSTGPDSDELVVVGEKGQIACRDYPHPRHLCANFPYSSTPHERHCGQCHCYVCDSLAPCMKWGTGLSSTDHCHATDKSDMWKTLRKNFKLGKTAPLSPSSSTNCVTLGDVGNSQHNHILPLDITPLSPNSMLMNQTPMSTAPHTRPLVNPIPQNHVSWPIIMCTRPSLNSTLQNQVYRPNTHTVPAYSMANNYTMLHGANHGSYQGSGSALVRKRYQSHSVPRQLLGVRNHVIQRGQGHGAFSLRPQCLSSNLGFGSNLAMNHSTHAAPGFSNHVNPACQCEIYNGAAGFPNNRTYYGQNDIWVPKNVLYPQPSSGLTNLRCVRKYTPPYEIQPYYQLNGSQNFYGYSNDAPSNYVAPLNRNQYLNEHQIGSQNENALGNMTRCEATRQGVCQQKLHDENQSEYARNAGFPASDSSWAENTSKNISYLPSSGSINMPPNAGESSTQFNGSTNLLVDDIKHWLFDDEDSAPVEVDGALASEQSIPSSNL